MFYRRSDKNLCVSLLRSHTAILIERSHREMMDLVKTLLYGLKLCFYGAIILAVGSILFTGIVFLFLHVLAMVL